MHVVFLSLHAFLNRYENTAEPGGWNNPTHKIKAPKVLTETLDPFPIETVFRIVNICKDGTFSGNRDAAHVALLAGYRSTGW